MSTVFLDTSYFKALLDVRDDFHEKASGTWKALQQQQTHLLTTNFILDESYTLIRKRCGVEAMKALYLRLVEDWRTIKIVRVTIQDEADAWSWIQHDWSNLSFTDCTSFAVMKRLGLTSVATFDNHFTRAGFQMV